jgi:hypothetical protein
VNYETATASSISLRITAYFTAVPTLSTRWHCWGWIGGFVSAANRRDYWGDSTTPVFDATPTIQSANPTPLELDTDSEREFILDGYGFGRATPAVQVSPAGSGLTVVSVLPASLPDGRPTPYGRFKLRLRGGANQANYTFTLVSIGSGPNGFQNGSLSQQVSGSYSVAVKAPQITISLRGQQVNHNQTIWLDPNDPTTSFGMTLRTVNALGDFDFRVNSSHKDPRDPQTFSQFEEFYFCITGQTPCIFPGLVAGGDVTFSWRLRPSSTWNSLQSQSGSQTPFKVTIRGLPAPSEALFRSHVINNLGDSPWFLKWIPAAESRFDQFETSSKFYLGVLYAVTGMPLWGPPHGYGMMQIDPPTGGQGNLPPITTMFNWRVNVDVARALLYVDKKPVADAYWRGQVQLWGERNLTNPGDPVATPEKDTGNCRFRFGIETPDQQNRFFTIDDANWIKAYNSISGGGNGWYVQFTGNGWQYNETNANNDPYVFKVCSAVQPQP